ncbi:MAG: serine/threonine-protein kinase [Thermoanaerobaculia bacterium]
MRYLTASLLRRGASGEVYRAYDSALDREVALKLPRRDDPVAAESMLREARLQALLDHPCLCLVHEICELDGRPCVVLELALGEELGRVAWKMDLGEKVEVVRQVAEGLASAHRLGLVHRDLKPENILVERTAEGRWRPKVVDFGLAEQVAEPSLDATGAFSGTPGYQAPEQVRGEQARISAATDVWALGAILYELLAGAPPFQARSRAEARRQLLFEPPVGLRSLAPQASPDLEAVVLRCLAKEPGERYRDASELEADLGAWLRGERPTRTRGPWPLRLPSSRGRKGPWLGFAALALVVAGAVARFEDAASERALRAGVLAAYAGRVGEIERKMAAAWSRPAHDLAGDRRSLESDLAALEADLGHDGLAAHPTARLLVARARLALGQPSLALAALELARRDDPEGPEIAALSGVLSADLHERARHRLERLAEPGLRARRSALLARTVREPALAALARGRQGSRYSAAYLESLGFLAQGRWAEAKAAARKAQEAGVDALESLRVEAAAGWAEAREEALEGRGEEASSSLRQAREALARGLARAPSAAFLALEACRLELASLFSSQGSGPWASASPAGTALSACNLAEELDSEAAEPLESLAQIALWQSTRSDSEAADPAPSLELAMRAARQATRLEPEASTAWLVLGTAELRAAELERGDSARLLQEARASLVQALELDPEEVLAANALGGTYLRQLEASSSNGPDDLALVTQAVTLFRRAVALAPDCFGPWLNLALAYLRQAEAHRHLGRGFSPALAAAEKALGEAARLRPQDPLVASCLGQVYTRRALQRELAGSDPTEPLEQAFRVTSQALLAEPQDPSPLLARLELDLLEARLARRQGQPAEPWVIEGRGLAERFLAAGGDPIRGLPAAIDVELESAGLAIAQGRAPLADLARAAAFQHRLSRLGEQTEAALAEARIQRWQAEWALAAGYSPQSSVEQGLAAAGEALASDPAGAEARALAGSLEWILARSLWPQTRARALARQASLDLSRALSDNAWLSLEFAEAAEAARRLAESTP